MLIALNYYIQKIILKKCIKLWAINSKICSILSFWVCLGFLHLILYMIYQGKCFSCYVLLTDQISLSDCFYFLRYLGICVLQPGFFGGEILNVFLGMLDESELDHLFKEEMDNIRHKVMSYRHILIYFIRLLTFSRF